MKDLRDKDREEKRGKEGSRILGSEVEMRGFVGSIYNRVCVVSFFFNLFFPAAAALLITVVRSVGEKLPLFVLSIVSK